MTVVRVRICTWEGANAIEKGKGYRTHPRTLSYTATFEGMKGYCSPFGLGEDGGPTARQLKWIVQP